jgi:hypothetical protein
LSVLESWSITAANIPTAKAAQAAMKIFTI